MGLNYLKMTKYKNNIDSVLFEWYSHVRFNAKP